MIGCDAKVETLVKKLLKVCSLTLTPFEQAP